MNKYYIVGGISLFLLLAYGAYLFTKNADTPTKPKYLPVVPEEIKPVTGDGKQKILITREEFDRRAEAQAKNKLLDPNYKKSIENAIVNPYDESGGKYNGMSFDRAVQYESRESLTEGRAGAAYYYNP